MHQAAYDFVASVAPALPGAVLEVGSFYVNGSVRPLFAGATRYHGIDVRGGPGVDEVAGAADYDGAGVFDTVVSTETMEHMADPAELVACAKRALRPGGMFILTAAGEGRQPHSVNGGAPEIGEAYGNITREQLAAMFKGWKNVQIVENPIACDIYAVAVKR